MIRKLTQTVDELFKVTSFEISLESALFRGGSDDGYWDARTQLDLLLDNLEDLKEAYGGEYGQSDVEIMQAMNLRIQLTPEAMETLKELRDILKRLES